MGSSFGPMVPLVLNAAIVGLPVCAVSVYVARQLIRHTVAVEVRGASGLLGRGHEPSGSSGGSALGRKSQLDG